MTYNNDQSFDPWLTRIISKYLFPATNRSTLKWLKWKYTLHITKSTDSACGLASAGADTNTNSTLPDPTAEDVDGQLARTSSSGDDAAPDGNKKKTKWSSSDSGANSPSNTPCTTLDSRWSSKNGNNRTSCASVETFEDDLR